MFSLLQQTEVRPVQQKRALYGLRLFQYSAESEGNIYITNDQLWLSTVQDTSLSSSFLYHANFPITSFLLCPISATSTLSRELNFAGHFRIAHRVYFCTRVIYIRILSEDHFHSHTRKLIREKILILFYVYLCHMLQRWLHMEENQDITPLVVYCWNHIYVFRCLLTRPQQLHSAWNVTPSH